MQTNQKREPTFIDTDLMPFGKYRDEPLQDVHASYLQWLWRDGVHEFSGDGDLPMPFNVKRKLANYIWNSQDALAQETGETL